MPKNLILVAYDDVYIEWGLILSFKLDVVGFFDTNWKWIYFKPFIYTIKCIDHIGLEIIWSRIFYYYTCVISK